MRRVAFNIKMIFPMDIISLECKTMIFFGFSSIVKSF